MFVFLCKLFSQYYYFAAYLGLLIFAYEMYGLFMEAYGRRESKNLLEEYKKKSHLLKSQSGKKMWALVTGGSEGIGFGFARQLAKRGFSAILISRTESKLVTACAELKKEFKDLDFKYLAKDFSRGADPVVYHEIIEFCKDLDVCILVNNVGTGSGTPLDKDTLETLHGMVVTNMQPQLYLSNHFQKVFKNRKAEGGCIKGGAIINLSSVGALGPSHILTLYAATKKWNWVLSNCADYRYSGEVDFLCTQPGFVTTRLTHYRKSDKITCTPDETAEYSLRALGKVNTVFGPPCHSIFGQFIKTIIWMPKNFVFRFITKKLMKAPVDDKK